jgi:hypothetical protein
MSQEQLWKVIGRGMVDDSFSSQLFSDFEGALKAEGYSLTPDEIEAARNAFSQGSRPGPSHVSGSGFDAVTESIKHQQQQAMKRTDAQVNRIIDLGNFTVEILKNTLNNAARTYRTVTLMSTVMFWMGVGLFLFAVIVGAVTKNLSYTAAFGGLGAASFVTLFLLGPIDRTQCALSNLIQAEISFMNYFEQITFWENFAMMPAPGTSLASHENIATASEALQRRSEETIELLQTYLEDDPSKRKALLAKMPSPAEVSQSRAQSA